MMDLDQSPRLQRISRSAAGFLIGGIIGLAMTILVWRGYVGDKALPPLPRAEWESALRKWEAAGLRNYVLEVNVTGRQAATYAVHVHDGQVSQATHNGEPLPQQRTWTTWTVDGMFETIARDLESVERHAAGRADSSTPQLQLRAAFHPEFGYPQQYLRTEMVRFGANIEVSWTVTKFKRL
jgi:hypothetical protein